MFQSINVIWLTTITITLLNFKYNNFITKDFGANISNQQDGTLHHQQKQQQ